ncbi:hypothetical protein FZC83_19055 [Rossellomorea marisflavi]|uniref:Phycobilisome protein n=2 Tax=Rossellomorea marisflavi TaxID=189381 RepID=A0A5D4RI14_9BACI|nr:hypothetical protein [Rossellomorea marisflavi]KQU62883.1 hypothetical protein ASG66_00245 [Bacillus sp. Leaf406]TYS50520.1 hypothetical protein FZC83_19055 [Rossellomorea marisflavi]WJV18550.1 hypothetical protein QU593_20895 [Rossellomorea marisflavi]
MGDQLLIDTVVEKLYKRYPDLQDRFGEEGRRKCREDNVHHFNYLQSAADVEEERIFVDYAIWLNSVLVSRGMKPDHLIDNFVCIQEAIEEGEGDSRFPSYLQAAIRSIRQGEQAETPS